jgi:hypothetical protein
MSFNANWILDDSRRDDGQSHGSVVAPSRKVREGAHPGPVLNKQQLKVATRRYGSLLKVAHQPPTTGRFPAAPTTLDCCLLRRLLRRSKCHRC